MEPPPITEPSNKLLIVQQVASNLGESQLHSIPDHFIYKNGYTQPIESSLPYFDDIFIDLNLLSSPSSTGAEQQLDKLRSALQSSGCFQVVNHGMSSSFLDELRELSKQFFALPMEEKMKYAREQGGTEGYGDEQMVVDGQVLDWNDGLSLSLYPQQERKLKHWPEKPRGFKEMLHEFGERVKGVFEGLVKATARSLKLEEDVFFTRYGEKVELNARFNFYPRCPIPDRVLGLKPHTDFSTMTIILQDKEVEGLQVMKDGKWYKVAVHDSALFVNLGDAMEVMSNGIFKSTMHRVVTSPEKERISVAMFWDNDRQKEIGPMKELITEDRPQMYKSVSIMDYMQRFISYYPRELRAIDTLRI